MIPWSALKKGFDRLISDLLDGHVLVNRWTACRLIIADVCGLPITNCNHWSAQMHLGLLVNGK